MLRRSWLLLTLTLGPLAAPLPVEAQQAGKVYRIGVLKPSFPPFRLGQAYPLPWLAEFGYVMGENIRFDTRSAALRDERLPELAAELVRLKVDVIVTTGMEATRAAKQATRTIPIVMVADGDPVKAGLVASLARPGGNITGLTTLAPELMGKRLELLTEVAPKASRVAVLWNSADPNEAERWKATQTAAKLLGVELQSVEVRGRADLEPVFSAAISERPGALLVLSDRIISRSDPYFFEATAIAKLAAKSRLPAMYPSRRFVDFYARGGLMSYGPSNVDLSRRVAAYVHKILQGAKPADLPIEQPTRFELVLNLKTAKALGITFPDSVLIRADKLIE